MFSDLPLTPAAKAVLDRLRGIPLTEDPLRIDYIPPAYEDPDAMETLHAEILSGSNHARAKIVKLVREHPDCPTFFNFLHAVHMIRNERRQADAALREMKKLHPDYLFTRIGAAKVALRDNDFEQALRWLGPDLELPALYPERTVFHLSEFQNYYDVAAEARLLLDDGDHFLGIAAALTERAPHSGIQSRHQSLWFAFNQSRFLRRIREDERKRVSVTVEEPDLRPTGTDTPTLHHPDLVLLYHDYWDDLHEETREEVLKLPRETVIEDVLAIANDCIANTGDWMEENKPSGDSPALISVISILGEIAPRDGLDVVLRALSCHPDIFAFWLGESVDHEDLVPLVATDPTACTDWLAKPGIYAQQKFHIIQALENYAKNHAGAADTIADDLAAVLARIIDSKPEENLRDSLAATYLCAAVAELGGSRHDALILRTEELGLLEPSFNGTAEEMIASRDQPLHIPAPASALGNILDFPGLGNNRESGIRETDPPLAGRNDPCPCGSGRKYKKCCLK